MKNQFFPINQAEYDRVFRIALLKRWLALRRFNVCRYALRLVNKLPKSQRKKHRSRIITLMNKLRSWTK